MCFYIYIQNKECILYYLQNRSDEIFNKTKYTYNMIKIFCDCYKLPPPLNKNQPVNSQFSHCIPSSHPFDELFMWSLVQYSGKEDEFELIKAYLSLCKDPIACCLIGVIIYKRLYKAHYIPDKLKEKLLNKIRLY